MVLGMKYLILTVVLAVCNAEVSGNTVTPNLETTSVPKICLLSPEADTKYALAFVWDASFNSYEMGGNTSLLAQAAFTNAMIDIFERKASYHVSAIGGETMEGNCRYHSETGNFPKSGRKMVNNTVSYYMENYESSFIEFAFAHPACAVNPALKRFYRDTKGRKQILFHIETDTKHISYRKYTKNDFEAENAVKLAKDFEELRSAGVTVVTISASPLSTFQHSHKKFIIDRLESLSPKFARKLLLDGCDIPKPVDESAALNQPL